MSLGVKTTNLAVKIIFYKNNSLNKQGNFSDIK